MKKHNFSAGPSILPSFTIEECAKAVNELNNIGLSLLEISHRSADFQSVVDEAQVLIKELLNVPEGYEVLFLQGGASTQFCMIPFNLLEKKAAYIDTGAWANKAIKEAKLFGEVEVLGSSKETTYNFIPKDYEVPSDVDYFHITTNNTIYGTEIHDDYDVSVPLIADMSSDIFSRPVDVSKYDLIYAGAQKNLGPAGVTLVIIKKDILGKVSRKIPTMLDYNTHIDKGSMFNTPPVFPIFASLQTLKWLKANGGLEAMYAKNKKKSDLLYNEIDSSEMFEGTAALEDRSIMNVTFIMKNKDLEPDFLEFATKRGCSGIKGHRSVGGFRASIYNAMPYESVEHLVNAMKEFAQKYSSVTA
jgi:phosphoserine aminotransferase